MRKITPKKKKQTGRPKDVEKHAAILAAASCHFMQHGFDRANMDAIAASANVSKLTIYSHFGSKDELFKAMITHRCEAHRINDDYHALSRKPVKKALVEIGERFLELMYTPDVVDLNRVIISEASTKPKIAQLLYEAGPAPCKAAFKEFLCEMHARGELMIDDAERATQHFFCLLKGERFYTVLMNLQGPPSKREKNAHLKDCIEVFVRAYQPAG